MKAASKFLGSGVILAAVAVLTAAIILDGRCESGAEISPTAQPSAATRKSLNPNRATFYEVALVCPAAPNIGCGSASKPVLVGLESNAAVSEAWLNRAGTVIAVVWSGQSTARQRSGMLKNVLRDQLAAKELKGAARIKP